MSPILYAVIAAIVVSDLVFAWVFYRKSEAFRAELNMPHALAASPETRTALEGKIKQFRLAAMMCLGGAFVMPLVFWNVFAQMTPAQ